MPLGVNSLCSPYKIDVVYEKWLLYTKNSELRLIFKRMSFTAHWQCIGAEVQKLLSSMPQRLAEISQKKCGQPINCLCIDIRQIKLFFPSDRFYWAFCLRGLTFLVAGCISKQRTLPRHSGSGMRSAVKSVSQLLAAMWRKPRIQNALTMILF